MSEELAYIKEINYQLKLMKDKVMTYLIYYSQYISQTKSNIRSLERSLKKDDYNDFVSIISGGLEKVIPIFHEVDSIFFGHGIVDFQMFRINLALEHIKDKDVYSKVEWLRKRLNSLNEMMVSDPIHSKLHVSVEKVTDQERFTKAEWKKISKQLEDNLIKYFIEHE